MKEVLATFITIVGFVFIFVLLSFMGYESYKYFAPRYAQVDNQVFHETQSYNDGMIRDLENLQIQYNSSPLDQKEALKATILHRFSVYPEEKLPPNLRNFYNQLKGVSY